jgi:hypothetical protein
MACSVIFFSAHLAVSYVFRLELWAQDFDMEAA